MTSLKGLAILKKRFPTARRSRLRASLLALAAGVLLAVARDLSSGRARTPQAEALPAAASVRRVIDGDTVELTDGRLVRYIGIDTPELRRKEGYQWVMDPEPFAEAAARANRRLVEGQRVRLEYDIRTHDRFGRLLAYVYVGELMVNDALLREGYAQLLTIPPDVKYAARFRRSVEDAQAARRGLWGGTER